MDLDDRFCCTWCICTLLYLKTGDLVIPTTDPIIKGLIPLIQWLDRLLPICIIALLLLVAHFLPENSQLISRKTYNLISFLGFAWSADVFFLSILKLADIFAGTFSMVLGEPNMLRSFLIQVRTGQIMLAQTFAGIIIAIWAQLIRDRVGARVLTLFAVLALLPPALGGHSGSNSQHQLAITSWGVHILSVSLWVAGVLSLVILIVLQNSEIFQAAKMFSPLALICFIGTVVSGVINASLRIDLAHELFSSRYGLILLSKIIIFIMLGGLGAFYRFRILNSFDTLSIRGVQLFTRLIGAELFLMSMAIMLAAVLSQTKFPTPLLP